MKKVLLILICILSFTPGLALADSVDSSAPLQKDIASVSPAAAQVAQPLFVFIDGLRVSMAGVLDSQLAATKTKLVNAPQPVITNLTATKDAVVSNPGGMFWFVAYTIYFYLLTILRWLVGTAMAFYPVLLILILYILWRLFRWWRRPRY